MKTITNIEADSKSSSPCVSWRIGADRFHVWVRAGEPEETIYKNSVAGHGEPGHYNTRQLDRVTSKVTAAMFAEVWAVVERDDLLAKAEKAETARIERVRRAQVLQAERYRIEQQVLASWKLEAFNCSSLAADLFKAYTKAGFELADLGDDQ